MLRLLARHDPHPVLYRVYQAGLQNFAGGSELEPVLRVFEKRLLQELGYGLPLDYEMETGAPLRSDLYYDYQLESGPVVASGEAAQGFIFKGSSLLALSRERLTTVEELRDARRLMRAALSLYLGNKPLKSRELFRSVKKLEK